MIRERGCIAARPDYPRLTSGEHHMREHLAYLRQVAPSIDPDDNEFTRALDEIDRLRAEVDRLTLRPGPVEVTPPQVLGRGEADMYSEAHR